MNYTSSFIRYEYSPHNSNRIGWLILIPSKFTKEWVGDKFITTRVTIVKFPVPESHYLSSVELEGWGSCSVKGDSNFPPQRSQLITMGYIRPGLMTLDHLAWKSHRRERYLIERATKAKARPVDNTPCDCGICCKCVDKWSDQIAA